MELQWENLTSESVEGASLPLESIDHIHGGDGLPLGVLGVGDGIPDDVLEEDLENSTGLLIDESGDTLDSTTTGQPPDGGLDDALEYWTCFQELIVEGAKKWGKSTKFMGNFQKLLSQASFLGASKA